MTNVIYSLMKFIVIAFALFASMYFEMNKSSSLHSQMVRYVQKQLHQPIQPLAVQLKPFDRVGSQCTIMNAC